MATKRSICIICKCKKYQSKMVKHGQHWTCLTCLSGGNSAADHSPAPGKLRALNLYAGIGGNRFLWPVNIEVTAVEMHPQIAAEYKRNFPQDHLIIGDAHQYLLKNYNKFDVIWSSPPCQTHSRMNYFIGKKRYPDLSLYQQIIFLQQFFSGKYVVENVRAYYDALISPDFKINRHWFWSNVPQLHEVKLPEKKGFIGSRNAIQAMSSKDWYEWLGMPMNSKHIYLSGKNREQVYRNCVHPLLGQSIFNDILASMH